MEKLKFGEAVEASRKGKIITRPKWMAKGKFVFSQVDTAIPATIIPKMQSLPQSVKDEFANRGAPEIRYCCQLAVVGSHSNEISSYLPSAEDLHAEDWFVKE
jgi:hypothetical protein